jgi:uncharacterized protein (TIGR03382 family)
MSADEKTADPRFVLNPDLSDVARRRDATLVTHCSPGVTTSRAPRILRLSDGRELWIPADVFFGGDVPGWLANTWSSATETIERTGRSGPPTVMEDHRGDIDATLASLRTGACGCADSGAAGSLAGVVAALAGLRRRRR